MHDPGICSICGRTYNKFDYDNCIILQNNSAGTESINAVCVGCFESTKRFLRQLKEETNGNKKQRGY